MGGGFYLPDRASVRRERCYAHADQREIFSRSMDPLMDPHNKIRECCENAEHPEVFPIILGLDDTGSMGHIPTHLIKYDFVEVMKKILQEGIECPQVCFVAYGDHECDDAPLQIGQFEASDELMEKWLTSTWIESGGGNNPGESTSLVHYFAARHTSCDAITKRGKKGLLITIGDEPTLMNYPAKSIKKIFGDGLQSNMTATEILEEAKKGWDVYHINILDYSGRRPEVQDSWKELLGDHLINVESGDNTKVSNVIAALAIKSYKEQNGSPSQCSSSQDNMTQSDVKAETKHDEVKTHRRHL
jgi:hypothetical protein